MVARTNAGGGTFDVGNLVKIVYNTVLLDLHNNYDLSTGEPTSLHQKRVHPGVGVLL